MIKLMVVDDEPLFRDYIRTTIDFESYGFHLCCEAKNGVEALALAKEHDPDVVLTDINMPLMDGLTLSEQLLVINPDMAIVLITGHSEFQYAKKAVKIGVSDYILKPFEKEELILTLLKLKDHIYQTIDLDLSTKSDDLKQSLFLSLINQELKVSSLVIQQLISLGLGTDQSFYIVTTLAIDDIDQKWSNIEEKMLWRFAVKNILNEFMEEEGNHHSFYDYEGHIVSINELKGATATIDTPYHQRLKTLINDYLGLGISIGVGNCHLGFEGIKTSYAESITALSAKFILGSNQTLHYNNLPKETTNYTFYNATINEQCLHHLRRLDQESLDDLLTSIFHQTHTNHLDQSYTRMIYMSLISLVLSYIAQSDKSVTDILGESFSPYNLLTGKSTLIQWEGEVKHVFSTTIDYLKSHQPSRAAMVAIKACDYIAAHYASSQLSVTDVAGNQFINQTYLRSMFKEEMGLTVSDYITKTRMENAKSLLEEKKYLLSDIAEQVGYSDASYFSKSFKKNFGISPSQYEKSLL